MNCFKTLFVVSIFFMSSFSACASNCLPEWFGRCIWGLDEKNSANGRFIDSELFLEFCAEYELYCYGNYEGINSIMGRNQGEDTFIIFSDVLGRPDLIFDNKSQAEQFINRVKDMFPNTLFYVDNLSRKARNVVAIAYREKATSQIEEVKLLFLPNEWRETGELHKYIPR